VWVVSANGSPRRIAVKAGLSDGTVTAIESDELKEGDNVILGEAVTAAAPQGTTNPFAPRMNRGGNRPGGGGR
jgi:hypothetical protein